ncbi:MAG: amino acid adenylation domain-containing protein, partial [Ginsengibacter sp.]
LDGNVSFKDLLKQVKRTTLQAYENQEVPFEKVVELVLTERDASRSPLFQVMFAFQNARNTKTLSFSGLEVIEKRRHASGPTTSKFDLTFNACETLDGLEIFIEYRTDIFKEERILNLAAHFNNLLKAAVITPGESIGRMQLLNKSEIQYLLKEVNNTNQEFSQENIISLFQAQVNKTPAAIALIFENEQITYGELNGKANQLAHYLIYSGIEEEALVPVCMPRSINLVTAMLAILKAGAAYVPIDPLLPAERINYLIKDINPSFIIAKESVLNPGENWAVKEVLDMEGNVEIFKDYPINNTALKIRPGQLAYVIYTSGSTGKPKGVMVEHGGLTNLINWHKSAFEVNNSSIASSMAGIGFDAFGWEVWPYLSCGASVHLIHDDLRTDLLELIGCFSKYNITHSFIPTALVPDFVTASKQNQLSIKYLLTGGDRLAGINTSGLNFTLVNNYGPTETTVVATSFVLPANAENHNPSIGKPIANTCVYLLNEQQQLVPGGSMGEVYIGGKGVARGYLNRKELTNEKFIRNPFTHKAGERLYRSGDLARLLPDGTLEYIGRIDHQVKIRGFRIELGEIENVLMEHDFIHQALVLTRQDGHGEKKLVAYLIASAEYQETELLLQLKKVLPEYMIPSSFVLLENFPLTVNGKIDQDALPAPDVTVTISSEAPATKMEIELEKIWNNILGRENTGRRKNFFSLGGHSLLAIRMIAAIRLKLGVEVKVNDLFINPTIAELGAALEDKLTGKGSSNLKNECLIPLKTNGSKPPLYIIAGGGGTALRFKSFGNLLEHDQPVFVLQPPIDLRDLENFPATVEGIAERFIEEIMLQNPFGPYALAGHCMGGIIAFEIAKQLKDKGKQVTTLAMFDTVINETMSGEKMVLNNFKKIFYKSILKWHFE